MRNESRSGQTSTAFVLRQLTLCILAVPLCWAEAAEIALAGVIGRHAVLVIDGGAPQTIRAGAQSREGVRVLAVDGDAAEVEYEGQRQRLRLGDRVVNTAGVAAVPRLELTADSQGHFWAQGRINGGVVRFLVDTGATMVALGRSDAQRLGVNFSRGERAASVTANGTVTTWRVRLDTVEIEGMRLHNVEAMVHENDLPVTLLGMSVLNRMRWQREGQRLTLEKRY